MERNMEVLTWDQAKSSVSKVNPNLAQIIDKISPDSNHKLIKVTYSFGDEILKKATLQLPDKQNNLIPFGDDRLDKKIKEELAYCLGSNPVALVLKNSAELFIDLDSRVMPFGVVSAGAIFGTWRVLDTKSSYCPETSIWGLTAGARSLVMLPKISDSVSHSKLRNTFDIKSDKPRDQLEHWKVFREIANSPYFTENWNTELLFFTGKWFEHREDDAWLKFNYHILDQSWQGSGYWRNQFIWELVFSLIQEKRQLKPPLYLTKLVKHLLAVGTGSIPSFQPAKNDNLAPIKKLQEAYIECYGLKSYAPIIMQPAYFSPDDSNSQPVYYSLQLPTAMAFSLKSSERTTALTDLYYFKSLLCKYIDEISSSKLKVKDTRLYDAIKQVEYTCFHSNTGGHTNIRNSSLIPIEDNAFTEAYKSGDDAIIPKNTSFFNGCIRVAKNNYNDKT